MDNQLEARAQKHDFSTLSIEPFDSAGFDMFDAAMALASGKRLIVGMTIAGAVLAAIAAFRMPDVYTATAVIMPPAQQRPMLGALLGQVSPIPGASLGSGSGSDLLRSPADLYIALLSSRSVADGIVEDQKLQAYYRSKNLTGARAALARRTKFTSGKDSLIRIAVQDADPQRAPLIANAYIEKLYALNSRFAVTESAQRRVFFDRQLEIEKKDLAAAEAEMKGIQERTGLLQVNSQVEVVIRSIAQLRAEITSREVMLEGTRSGATDQNPEVIRQRTEIESLRARLQQLQNSQAVVADPSNAIAASRMPGAGLEYLRALRNLKYHESLYEVLAKQRESARIDEAKQSTVVQVVDYAVVPEIKSGPSRLLYILLGAASQCLLGIMIVLGRRAMRQPERANRFAELRRALWR
jgi:uncharacterized protein involved in exopolysaccharide biosynthesis